MRCQGKDAQETSCGLESPPEKSLRSERKSDPGVKETKAHAQGEWQKLASSASNSDHKNTQEGWILGNRRAAERGILPVQRHKEEKDWGKKTCG